MSKRTILLCASIGTLVFSAGSMSPAPPLPDPTASSAVFTPASEGASLEADASGPSFQQLTAAYAPSGAQESDQSPRSVSGPNARKDDMALPPPPTDLEESTLWLARAIYSETKLPHEQELVAWVVRNRVETAYRGQRSYREVVLDPYQFSAFNPGAEKRAFYRRLRPEAPLPRWRQALWVARYVRHAAPAYRPFSVETRHFYSERSMRGQAEPYWADGAGFVAPDPGRYAVDERRFRFFKRAS